MANYCRKNIDSIKYCIDSMKNPYATNTHANHSGGKTSVNCSSQSNCRNQSSQTRSFGSSTAPATDFVSTAGFFNGAHPGLIVTK